jgi:hypothetical protein
MDDIATAFEKIYEHRDALNSVSPDMPATEAR